MDDAAIKLSHTAPNKVFMGLEVGAHGHGSGGDLQWQQFSAGRFWQSGPSGLKVEAARDWHANLGAWYLFANAKNRFDERADAEHQHGVGNAALADIQFNGDTAISAIHADLQWHLVADLRAGISGEYLGARADFESRLW